ncbi:MAG: UDP-2,3-diacylglucosamine diphosphatase [Candidatus Kryptonium sp.]|nr:UDP-2,3-diacylglucosamine diphosphatase [Candidatus Kryptonium sp.]MCX7761491.1 UDP-2,3-diacylglucosamine diphosphatase [Candidatus Kryptonium sp.]MDW8109521.1 UDP-2,3-diacylglucosamine diphosphatase [Candidatus Kryptonium sp.]
MEKAFFISDVHLGHGSKESNRAKEIELVRFLNLVGETAQKLFILGDFFDVWFEYKLAVPKGFTRTLGKLAELSDNGVEIFYVLGNHDFWVRDYFESEIGIKIFKDELKIEINGKKFYIVHGDGLSKSDKGYKILKKILRNKTNIALFSLLHPDFGLWLASASSRKSREYSINRDSKNDEKDIIEFATEKIKEGFDYVVMGHLHKPAVLKIGNGFYINTGDWLWNFTYGVFSEEFEIKKWNFANEEVQRLLQK